MIIDRHTFMELATHAERASQGALDATNGYVAIAEQGGPAIAPQINEAAAALLTTIQALGSIEQLLSAVLEANVAEQADVGTVGRA